MLVHLLACLLLASTAVGRPAPVFERRDGAASASGSSGVVSCEVAECSQIGVDALRAGGNAVDAVIATSLCVGVVNAFHSGQGGGGFAIVRVKDGAGGWKHEQIDFREEMPAAGNATLYLNQTGTAPSRIDGLAVGIPGEPAGFGVLHAKYAKRSWASLFEPSIKLARDGFTVGPGLADALDPTTYPFLISDSLFAESYAPNGSIARQGDTIYRKRYASALEDIGESATHELG